MRVYRTMHNNRLEGYYLQQYRSGGIQELGRHTLDLAAFLAQRFCWRRGELALLFVASMLFEMISYESLFALLKAVDAFSIVRNFNFTCDGWKITGGYFSP